MISARRRLLSLSAVLALAVGGGALGVGSAAAATSQIGVSSDGVTYSNSLPAPLFAGVLIVPNTTVSRSFWVQNQASTPGHLALAVQNVAGTDPAFLGALEVTAATGSTAGA